jgi:putative aldouronate transport system permease protein
MGKRLSIGERIFDVFNVIVLSLVAVITLYPLLYVLFASVSDPLRFAMRDLGILYKPLGFQLEAYKHVFRNPMVIISFKNTAFYVVAGTGISLVLTLLGAYALARTGYMLRKTFTLLILFTMYFNGGLIPTFLIVRGLGMRDTVWAMLIPVAISTYNMIVMRTAFISIPSSLRESAIIDGANDFGVLFKIYIPLSIPTISVIGLFYAVSKWNEWFNALIYLRTRTLFPLQLILREILITSSAEYLAEMGDTLELTALSELIKYAAIIIATLPIMLVYPFIQKYFVKGVMIGAVKG